MSCPGYCQPSRPCPLALSEPEDSRALHCAVQERNLKFPEGGPEASRITATCRRKLGTLGGLLDSLRSSLEAPQHAGM